jgi:small conductance mechanosensitive channel
MIFNLLQMNGPTPEEIAERADSAKVTIEQFAENLAKDPSTTLQNLGQDAIEFGIKLVVAILVYMLGAWLIGRIKKSLVKVFNRKKTDKVLSSFVISITTITLTILLITAVIGTLGVNTTSFAALLAAGGMAIGMAMSGTVQNFAGGIMILAFKPFKAGDFIEAQGYSGTVTTVSITSTTLTTTDNRTIIIPNGTLINGNINNFSRNPVRRVEWNIGVEYGTDAEHCCSKLLELVKADPRVIDSSVKGAADPSAVITQLGDSAVTFTVKAWVKTADYWDVLYDYNKTVYTELPKAGINFPFPQVDVHLRNS